MHANLLCTVDEFWTRASLFVSDLGLVCFKRHQQSGDTVVLANQSLDHDNCQLAWQWDLWIAEEEPSDITPRVPAQAGWIQITPTEVDESRKLISGCSIGAQDSWLSDDKKSIVRNERIKIIYGRMKKILFVDTQYKNVTEVWEPKFPNRSSKMRFTVNAKKLQELGWKFTANPAGKNPLILRIESDTRV